MIKDRNQKKLAAKFCAMQGVIPFLEVVVRSKTGLEEQPVDITDIDVLGLAIGRSGVVQRTLFDCKSGTKLSAINRSLWASGLKSLVSAEHAYVIQKRDTPFSHKLVARSLGVSIHSEDDFVRYAKSISTTFSIDVTYLDDLAAWDVFVGLARNQPALSDLVQFITAQAALEANAPRGLRLGLGALIKSAPELDPRKSIHQFLFANFVSAFLIFLSLSSSALKEVFTFSMPKYEFERVVRYYLWEGRENYLNRKSMKAAIDKARGEQDPGNFDLPEWDRLLRVVRSFLDAPDALASLPFLAKEIAFRTIAQNKTDIEAHLRSLFETNNRARQFIFATVSYLVSAAKLPKEFSTHFEASVNGLINPAPAAVEYPDKLL